MQANVRLNVLSKHPLRQMVAPKSLPRSLTDPDSRPMLSGGRIEVCYTVQTAVDATHKLIVAEDVTGQHAEREDRVRQCSQWCPL